MDTHEITQRLAAPFDPALLKWRPGACTKDGTKGQALAYIDARLVQDRLDDVLGVDGWQDDYELLPDGNVVCRLRVRIAGEWIVKTDIGGQSEQPDDGDKCKAAFSDALKRAAVKFGVGRFLYRFPQQWVALNERKQFAARPVPPDWYMTEWKRSQPQPEPAKQNGAKPDGVPPSDCITKQQATEIDGRLAQAGIVLANGQADWRGICAAYHIQRKGQLAACHMEDLRQRITRKHASILPPADPAPAA